MPFDLLRTSVFYIMWNFLWVFSNFKTSWITRTGSKRVACLNPAIEGSLELFGDRKLLISPSGLLPCHCKYCTNLEAHFQFLCSMILLPILRWIRLNGFALELDKNDRLPDEEIVSNNYFRPVYDIRHNSDMADGAFVLTSCTVLTLTVVINPRGFHFRVLFPLWDFRCG